MKVLVTGGAGYIGSHTTLELLSAGHEVDIVDNLSNSSEESLARVAAITGKSATFHKVDIGDKDELTRVFETKTFDAVIHFAALKAVGAQIIPHYYYIFPLLNHHPILLIYNHSQDDYEYNSRHLFPKL